MPESHPPELLGVAGKIFLASRYDLITEPAFQSSVAIQQPAHAITQEFAD
ncbi:MAG: hypothetical protein ACRETL_00335 [Gammaproteobacteria bacterium]